MKPAVPDTALALTAYKLFTDKQFEEDVEAREYRSDEFQHRIKNPVVRHLQLKYGTDYGTNFLNRVCSLVENSMEISGFTVKAPSGEEWPKEKVARARRKVSEIITRTQFADILFQAAVEDQATYGTSYLRVWGHPDNSKLANITEVDAEHGRLKYRQGSVTIPEYFVERFKVTAADLGIQDGDPKQGYTGLELEFPDGHLEHYWAKDDEVLKDSGWHPWFRNFVPDPADPSIAFVDDDGEAIPYWPTNGMGRMMVTHLRNKKGKLGYGEPAHYNGYKSQNEMTTTVNSRQQALDYGGVGSVALLGDQELEEKFPGYGTALAASPFFNPFQRGEQDEALFPVKDEWVSGPGAVNRVNGVKQVVQLKAESIQNFLDGEERSLNYLCSVTETAFIDMLPNKGQALGPDARRQGRFGFIRKIKKLTGLNYRAVQRVITDAVEFEAPDLAGLLVEPQFTPPDDFDAQEVISLAQTELQLYSSMVRIPEVAQIDILKKMGKSDEWIEVFLEELQEFIALAREAGTPEAPAKGSNDGADPAHQAVSDEPKVTSIETRRVS